MDSMDMMREDLKKKFRGNTVIESKYIPKFPDSAERDYLRFMNAMIRDVLKAALRDSLPELVQILKSADKDAPRGATALTLRLDADDRQGEQAKKNKKERAASRLEMAAVTMAALDVWLEKVKEAIRGGMGIYHVREKLNIIADANRKLTVKEWKKAIGKTLGINILEDYYDGSFYADILEQWVNDNVDLISTIPSDMLVEMKKLILKSYLQGDTVTTITKQIEQSYGTTRSHAELIARDQMGKLNCQITRHQQQSCGVNKYIWRTAGDGRVRAGDKKKGGVIDPMGDNHKRLDKQVFSWDDPPLVDRKRGRRCHPGEDYQCRCIAVPVLDLDTIDLPISTSAVIQKGRYG